MKKWLGFCMFSMLILFCGCQTQSQDMYVSPAPATTAAPTPDITLSPVPTEEPTPAATPQSVPEDNTIASSYTKIYDKDSNRTKNLKIAAKAVDGTIVQPNQVFSFNDTVGPRTEKKGYKQASVLIGEEHTTGIGGGVCQVSTTIFNAAEKAGLEIVERHKHQVEVAYAKNGTDATVNYGTMDMKFKNTRPYSIMIRASVNKSRVTVVIKQAEN